MPDGAMRKARPKAAAACGTDSSGETRCWTRAKIFVPDQPATKNMTMASEMAVVARPTERLSAADIRMPGWANSSAMGARVNAVPPSAGR